MLVQIEFNGQLIIIRPEFNTQFSASNLVPNRVLSFHEHAGLRIMLVNALLENTPGYMRNVETVNSLHCVIRHGIMK